MPYYMVKDGQRVGPLSDEEFQNQVLSGEVGPDTLVWRPGMTDWRRYAEHAGTEAPAPETPAEVYYTGPTGVCVECGRTFGRDDLVTIAGSNVCAGCKPLYVQRMREGAAFPGAFRYAGFWIRFLAKIVDGIILGVLGAAVQMGLTGMFVGMNPQPGEINPLYLVLSTMIGLVIGVSYCSFFLGKFGATPGKMAVGVHVVRSDGSKITYGRAAGRFFAEYLSMLIFYIGYIMAGFDEQKRALHDHICDTRVVKN